MDMLSQAMEAYGARNYRRAEELCRQVINADPLAVDAFSLLGFTYLALGQPDEAAAVCRRAIQIRADHVDAHNVLGIALAGQRKWPDAEASFRQVIHGNPRLPDGYNNLGITLKEQGKLQEAEACYRHALQLKPNYPEALNNLGNVLREQGALPDAQAAFRNAIQLHPGYAEAHHGLGLVLKEQGDVEGAEAAYRRALQLNPSHVEAHCDLALCLLLKGDFSHGWDEYEWRWKLRGAEPYGRPLSQPLWDGSALHGRTILLHTEQGLGDSIQFIRYARILQERGARVILQCPRLLVTLLARCRGVDHVVPEGAVLPAFDVHAPLMTLPRLFGTTLQSIPAEIPYVSAEPERIAYWRSKLASVTGLKVGIVWRGSAAHRNDRNRSVALTEFARLAELNGVQLISLQRGPGRGELQSLAAQHSILSFDEPPADAEMPFLETAAIIMALDLIVSVDTAPVHLAGALGVPVWCALPFMPDWRWLLRRDDSPWYPTMRLFRQDRRGDWRGVFERMAEALKLHQAARAK